MLTWRVFVARLSAAKRIAIVLSALAASLVFVPSASAGLSELTADKANPVNGEPVTFEAQAYDCNMTFVWKVDGVVQPPITGTREFTTSFATAGQHTVSYEAAYYNGGCGEGVPYTETITITIHPDIVGSILVDPDPPVPGQAFEIAATQVGGIPGFTYAWDSDNDGQFDDQTSRTFTKTVATESSFTVRVRIRDAATPFHEDIVTKTINVTTPVVPTTPVTPTTPPGETPPDPPAPPAPAPCTKELAFQLSQFTTTGCFKRTRTTPSEQWTTTSSVTLNGIPFQDFGQTFTVTFPTQAEPGGRFTAKGSSIQLQAITFFSGDIDWQLPAGKQGEEAVLKRFDVFIGAKMFGLNVTGSIELRLGWDAKGVRYSSFPLNVELPVGFNSGPYESAGRVTGAAALRADAAGIHYDGLRIRATNVWMGKIKVLEVCMSYVPGGGQSVAPCEPIDAAGQPYIQCESNVNVDRWDGNAVVELPSSRGVQFGLFGGLAGGQVSKLGGYVDKLGNRIPIASGWYLNKVGLGICLNPPPLKIKGEIGVAMLPVIPGKPAIFGVEGSFTYTDGQYPRGWTLDIGGRITMYDTALGTAAVRFGPTIPTSFDVNANFNLFDVASIDGRIFGWVDAPSGAFSISGFVRGCLAGEICAEASGLISSTGVAGCFKAGSWSSTYLVILDEAPYLKFVERTSTFSIGVGYKWGASSPDMLGSSCSFTPYDTPLPAEASRARRLADAAVQTIAAGTPAVTLRYKGTNGPPKLVLTGPDGTTITSPADKRAAQVEGKYMLVENKKDGTTSVLLINPAAGDWKAAGAPGASSTPTSVDRSELEAPPTLGARVRGKGQARSVDLTYVVPEGASVQLVERGAGVTHVLANSVKGRSCGYGPKRRPGTDQLVRCAKVRFRPTLGPGGKRTISAVVTRDGVPLARQDVASYTAPKLKMPSKIGTMRARRSKGNLLVTFPKAKNASSISVSVVLSDGRSLSYDLKAKCGGVRVPKVPVGVSAKVSARGVRYDLAVGKQRTLKLTKKKKTAGPKGSVPKKQAGKICS